MHQTQSIFKRHGASNDQSRVFAQTVTSHKIRRCATCGQPVRLLMGEDRPQQPINPYGRSKLMVEQALFDLDRHAAFHSVILRYCNAAGADPLGHIGERHHPETPAPLLAIGAALGRRPPFEIFGDDYPTRGPTSLP